MEHLDLIAIDKVLQLLSLRDDFLNRCPEMAIKIFQNNIDLERVGTGDIAKYYRTSGNFSQRLNFWLTYGDTMIYVIAQFPRYAFREEFKFTIESLNESSTL